MTAPSNHRERWILAGVLFVGAALRGLYLAEISHTPEFTAPAVDAEFHHYWARALATGDWTPPHGQPDPHIRTTPFLRPPGYPYFLALIYRFTGPGFLAPRIVQMCLGLFNVYLAYRLGRRWHGPGVALTFAGLMAVNWVFLYYEGRFLEPVLLISLLLSATLLMGRWVRSGAWGSAIAAGLLLGLAATVRPNALLLIPVAVVWMTRWARRESARRTVILGAVLLVLGGVIPIAPVTLRNRVVADDWVLISSNAGVNLFLGNNDRADGLFTGGLEGLGDFGTCYDYPRLVRNVERRVGRPMKHSEVSRYFTRRALGFILDHPARVAKLTARKAALFWAPYEISHNSVVAYDWKFSKALRYMPFGFSFVSATFLLGVLTYGFHSRTRGSASAVRRAGLARLGGEAGTARPTGAGIPSNAGARIPSNASARIPTAGARIPSRTCRSDKLFHQQQNRITALILVFVVVYSLSFLPFFNASLYRVPLIPFLLFFAAYGLRHLWDCLRARNVRSLSVWGLAWAILGVICAIPWVPIEPDLGEWHFNRGVACDRNGDPQRALEHLERAKQLRPTDVHTRCGLANALLDAGRPEDAIAEWSEALTLDPTNLTVHHDLGNALLRLGRTEEAMKVYAAAVDLGSDYVAPYFNLANLLAARGAYDEAIRLFESGLRIDPEAYQGHVGLGLVLARAGNLELGIQHGREAVRLRPDSVDAHMNLGVLLKEHGRVREAIQHYLESLRLAPGHAHACHNLGVAYQDLGQLEEAARWYAEALGLDPSLGLSHRNLGQVLLARGKPAEAEAHLRRACSLLPQDAASFRDYGIVLLRLNRMDEAIPGLEKAANLDPSDMQTRQALAAARESSAER